MARAPRLNPTRVTPRSPWILFVMASERMLPALSARTMPTLQGLSTILLILRRLTGHGGPASGAPDSPGSLCGPPRWKLLRKSDEHRERDCISFLAAGHAALLTTVWIEFPIFISDSSSRRKV